jgi:hypothetical protein
MVNKIVKGFLEFQQFTSSEMIDRFLSLENLICCANPDNKEEKFLYRQGTAENEVLLVGYTDNALKNSDEFFAQKPIEKHNTCIGEGIDNKAGCAMLWTLRNFGYSFLVFNGSDGLNYLHKNQDLVNRIIEYRFIIQLNKNGNLDFESIKQSTSEFKKLIINSGR